LVFQTVWYLQQGNGEGVWVISPESGAKAGDKVS
jgi:methionyl-tRNA synthetase